MSDDNVQYELDSLRRRYDGFESAARMNSVARETGDLESKINKMPADIEQIRSRGYAFRSYLERKAEVFHNHWQDIRHRVSRAIDDEIGELRDDLDSVDVRIQKAERVTDAPEKLQSFLPQLESAIDSLENRIEAAEDRVKAIYSTLKQDVDSTIGQLRQINWICDRKDEASFDFLAGESVFLVAEAEWVATGKGKDDPDGFLFLTDQRLVFEQKEKVGKKLGMFGGKEVHELEWEIPLHQIESFEDENKGMFGGKDMLHFTLGSGAAYPKITVEVKGSADNKFWVKQIQRMIAGDTDDERAIEPDPEVVETLRNAPSECHVCGATIPMLVAGQSQVECAYCGTVIRL